MPTTGDLEDRAEFLRRAIDGARIEREHWDARIEIMLHELAELERPNVLRARRQAIDAATLAAMPGFRIALNAIVVSGDPDTFIEGDE